ncbi:MAG: UDP-3-O-[3-hydroxymyristoyl] N-acetylglucosamine deacetylase [Thermoanaerobaculia bacterium]|nr:UDP-3-O-[3-hydroxymyristoyl] N-acetylglucosamine deacetylase [Thermoanaerobaculia bacterium]
MRLQTTLGKTISVSGIGLHSGREIHATLRPAPAGRGIVFVRTDVGVTLPALAEEAGRLDYATSLGERGREVGTVEHLLSAAVGLGLDNMTVEVDGPEVPILDGSSAPWVAEIRKAGLVSLGSASRPFRVTKTLSVNGPDGKWIEIRPASDLRVSYSIDFPHPAVGRQSISLVLTPETYAEHLAPARTFGFLAEYDYLRSKGLAQGASTDNCIVVGDSEVMNGGLRFGDEFVRHKVLDLLGDLALVGRPVVGHIVAHRAGHALHTALAREIRQAVAGEHLRRVEPAPESVALAGR